MKILFTGAAPWCNSGYSKPWRYLFPRLHELGHEIGLCTFYGFKGSVMKTMVGSAPVTLFGAARDAWFNDIIQHHVGSFGADMVVTLQDVWVLQDWGKHGFVWLPWLPIDTYPVTDPVLSSLAGCYAPMSYSKWGRDELVKAGWPTARYMPFGVDLEMHQPRDRTMARRQAGLPEDGFIAGMVAANSSYPSRKSIPEVLLAWRKWIDGGGSGVLYLHTTAIPKHSVDNGLLFANLLDTLDLPWSALNDENGERRQGARVIFADQSKLWLGAVEDSELANLYNCFDVLLSPSMAEGFGIPIIEAQASGVPVVTLNETSMPELTFSGMCLDSIQPFWYNQGGWRGTAGVDDILGAIEWAHDISEAPAGRQHYADKARVGVEKFGWDKVISDHWVPLLEELN